MPDEDPQRPDHGHRVAAFFDLDKTILARSSTLAFSRPFYNGGLINRRAVLRSAYAQFVYLLGGADHEQMEKMRAYLSAIVTGWDVQGVKDIVAEALHHVVDPLVFAEAVALMADHQAAGHEVVIVSSSGQEVVEPIGELLGADRVIATRMRVQDGKYTGVIDFYSYGENKATAVRELAAERAYDLDECYAYSDSITDLPLLRVVGHPYAVNPDRALRRIAAENGWPVLRFARPTAVDETGSRTSGRRPALAVAVCAGAAMAVVWAVRSGRISDVRARVELRAESKDLGRTLSFAGRRP
ncbi:HAD-IB family hydrolase [Actinopolymorpha sp. NPDC004070]|uniref:HAD family hydrolase n=1 Tax=Actinopolymorpha sp. NPDC004070 TaxID=3154548 RepID=UPI0033BA9C0D